MGIKKVCKFTVHSKCRSLVTADCYTPKLIPHDIISYEHHWLQGNVKKANCIICNLKISTKTGGFESCACSRCNRQAHKKCLSPFLHALPPPPVSELLCCRPKYGEMLFCNELLFSDNPNPNYQPLLVFVNGKSGGQQGPLIIRELRSILTQAQVLDLFDHKPCLCFPFILFLSLSFSSFPSLSPAPLLSFLHFLPLLLCPSSDFFIRDVPFLPSPLFPLLYFNAFPLPSPAFSFTSTSLHFQ